MSYMNAAVAGAANKRRKPSGRGPVVAAKNKPSKGPGKIPPGSVAHAWAQFGGYCMAAKEWLVKAKNHREEGRPVLAAVCARYDTPAGAGATSLAAGNVAIIKGTVKPSADGDVIARFASEVSGSAITVKAGACVSFWEMN
ncbi:hypothetical protein GCM10023213_25150 [Prosthecobacter algae]|uniref:Uncharacterized protein n=1 Tax=Prosthecobacter algae TaxID=1144682 RepID=A0ABP9P7N4_9BACT